MDYEMVLRIIKALADGFDPITGETLPPEHCIQQGDVVRALSAAVVLVERRMALLKKRTNFPEASGKPWSEDEDSNLVRAYDSGKAMQDIAEMHKRTVYAIEARLAKLGKIPEPEWTKRYRTLRPLAQ